MMVKGLLFFVPLISYPNSYGGTRAAKAILSKDYDDE
jgi:hypothetical protein